MPVALSPKEFVQSPEALDYSYSVPEADAYTKWLATSHYENFHVVSFLLPKRLHQDFYNVVSRSAAGRTILATKSATRPRVSRLLAWWRTELEAMYRGQVKHPVFVALRGTAAKYSLPQQLFSDLITAFEQDQHITRYANWDELFQYCRNSANPVGRLVLRLCGYADPELDQLSDATCTALQLANFWQDVTVDLQKDRVYLPLDLLARHGYSLDQLQALQFTPAFRDAMREAVKVARELFAKGRALPQTGRPPAGIRSGIIQPRRPACIG